MKRFLSVTVFALLSACSSTTQEGLLICAMTMGGCFFEGAPVDKECTHEPEPNFPLPVTAASVAVYNWRALPWLNPTRFPTGVGNQNLSFEYITPALLTSKYKFVELKAPPRSEGIGLYPGFMELTSGLPADFVRLSIQKRAHHLCRSFETVMEKHKHWLPDTLKKHGLSDSFCVAVEIISKPASRYVFDVIHDERPGEGTYRWYIMDTEKNQPYAQLTHNHGRGIDCPAQRVRAKFLSLVRPDAQH